jgi:predicted lysophospholipase L1 biosynthesis ABC-type transport system permease subunit
MHHNLQRARDLLPAIVITVLSMIQALALELFWNRFQGSEYLWQSDLTAVIGWLQLLLMLLGIIEIWLFYVSLMLRFSWLPAMADTLVPFIIGLLEFLLIDLMGPDNLGPWLIGMAALFGICINATHVAHRRARRDPANDYFFSQMPRANWRDYLGSIAVVSILALLGAAIWHTDNREWLALAALLFGLSAVAYQFFMTQKYWMHTLSQGKPDTEPSEDRVK